MQIRKRKCWCAVKKKATRKESKKNKKNKTGRSSQYWHLLFCAARRRFSLPTLPAGWSEQNRDTPKKKLDGTKRREEKVIYFFFSLTICVTPRRKVESGLLPFVNITTARDRRGGGTKERAWDGTTRPNVVSSLLMAKRRPCIVSRNNTSTGAKAG